jgi:fumarylacetoacetase
MNITLNETHDASLKSWVASAQQPGCDFTIQNLPHGVFRRRGRTEAFRGGVAIGDQVLDMAAAHATGVFTGEASQAAAMAGAETLNGLMALGPRAWSALRLQLLSSRCAKARPAGRARALPGAAVAGRTCGAGAHRRLHRHATARSITRTNVGKLFRPDNPLMPNFKWLPVGYHGRASSIGVSGQQFHRPRGQVMPPGCRGAGVHGLQAPGLRAGAGHLHRPGQRAGRADHACDRADDHVFGLCLLNDWSARDIQAWEYQPLGPFLAKNFATTVSPWIVTLEALAPFRQRLDATGRGSAAPALPRVRRQPRGGRLRRDDRGLAARRPRLRNRAAAAAAVALAPSRHSYWSARADGHASRRGRLQPAAGRSAGHRDRIRSDRGRRRPR